MPNIDEKINALRERLDHLDARQENKAGTTKFFSNPSTPDPMRVLQGDITRLLTQAKLQGEFYLTSTQKTALEELRAEARQSIAGVKPSVVKESWTKVRQQAESSNKPSSAQGMFKKWAEEKLNVDEYNDKSKPEGPGPSSTNK